MNTNQVSRPLLKQEELSMATPKILSMSPTQIGKTTKNEEELFKAIKEHYK